MDHPRRRRWQMPAPRAQWATGLAALLLTAALVAALVYSRVGAQFSQLHTPPAPSVHLVGPEGLAVAPDGSIYVSDYVGNRVYRMQQNGSLVTVAGGGSQYDGVATKSNLFGPAGLAVAPDGDLYIADNLGTAIRKLDGFGMLSTFVAIHATGGGNSPVGITFDQGGSLYVGNFGGDVVAVAPSLVTSKIDLSRVSPPRVNPSYLAFDTAGNLYVSDAGPTTETPVNQVPQPPGGCRIIRIAPDRSVLVVAGTGKCGYSGDGGEASQSGINWPSGIAFDAVGNLYFADANNHRVRRIDSRGIITTIAGTGVEGHGGDGGRAVKAQLAYPAGLAMVGGRFLYVADGCGCMDPAAYGAVRVIDLSTGTITTAVSSRSRVVS